MDLRVSRNSELPLGVQLAQRIRSHVASGGLKPGDRLPSVREAAASAGVNVNTVRAVYGRLEREGVLHSVQGSGTFVATPAAPDDAAERRALREQIAALELELSRRPPPATGARPLPAPSPGGALLSAAELRGVRDDLMSRLRELDSERAELLRQLHELKAAELDTRPARHEAGTPSRAGARVRFVT
jgi:DNA-binding transcriptional regulator YhcF (GntR family)